MGQKPEGGKKKKKTRNWNMQTAMWLMELKERSKTQRERRRPRGRGKTAPCSCCLLDSCHPGSFIKMGRKGLDSGSEVLRVPCSCRGVRRYPAPTSSSSQSLVTAALEAFWLPLEPMLLCAGACVRVCMCVSAHAQLKVILGVGGRAQETSIKV